jgi:hypothetical protein
MLDFEKEWIRSYTYAGKVIKKKMMSSSFFYHLGAVRDESLMHGFA